MNITRRIIAVITIMVAQAAITGCSPHAIPQGSVGVKFNGATGISDHILKPEWVWTSWFNERLIIYPTSIQTASYVHRVREGEKQKDDSIRATTSEGATLPMDVTVSYRIPADKSSVVTVFKTFGVPDNDPDHPLAYIQSNFIRWSVIAAVNDVSARHTLFNLLTKDRATIGNDVKAELDPIMSKWGLRLESVQIREIHPPAEIERKLNEQQQARAEVKQLLIKKQQATTDGQTLVIQAQAEAAKNELLSKQGDQAVALKRLELHRIFNEKWDGEPASYGPLPISIPNFAK